MQRVKKIQLLSAKRSLREKFMKSHNMYLKKFKCYFRKYTFTSMSLILDGAFSTTKKCKKVLGQLRIEPTLCNHLTRKNNEIVYLLLLPSKSQQEYLTKIFENQE